MRVVCLFLLFFCSINSVVAQFKLVPFEYEIHKLIYYQPDLVKASQLIDSSAAKYGNEIGHEVLRIYLLKEKGNTDEALAKAGMLLDQNPNAVRALLAYGNLMLAVKKDYNLADSLYARAETFCSNTDKFSLYFVHMTQASSFFDQYQYDKVIALSNKILKNYPNASRVNGLLGALYVRQNNLKASLKYSKKAKRYSDEPYIIHNLAAVYVRQGKYNKAISMLEKIVAFCPNDDYTKSTLGFAYTQTGKIEEGRAFMNQSVQINPENPYPYRNLGIFYLQQKDTVKACEYFNKALELNFTKAYTNEVLELQQKHCK